MIDSWNSIELASLPFEFRSWKIHLLIFLLVFLLEFNHFQSRFYHFVSKPAQKNIRFRFFLRCVFKWHFFLFQMVFFFYRKTFSWIFVFRHFKHFQKCHFCNDNFGPRHFQFKNSNFFNLKFRSKDSGEIFNKQFNSSMFKSWSFSILTASAQHFPWNQTQKERKIWQQHDKKQIGVFRINHFY